MKACLPSNQCTVPENTKLLQTPRNPNLERPSAAMDSDVQERRVPSKPTSKKIATKGGKQPQKHMLHRLIKWTSTTGGIKKPHRYHPGLLAL